jgi:hypothetical protein
VNRLRWVWAQIELPGDGKRASLAMLLKPDELPGAGWKKLDQRAWRTGFFPNPSEAARRARDVESVSAIRSFEQANSRWVWIEVIPFVSAPDAESMLPTLPALFVSNPRAKVTVTTERRLDPHEAPDVASYPFVYEQSTVGQRGAGVSRYVAGTVGHIVFIVAFSALSADVSWADVAAVAAAQTSKISKAAESSSS